MSISDLIEKEITDNIDLVELSRIKSISAEKERIASISYFYQDVISKTTLSNFQSSVFIFTGKIYEEISDKELGRVLNKSLRSQGVSIQDLTFHWSKMYNVISMSFFSESNQLSIDKNVVCFNNCVLNLRTRTMHEHDPKFHVINKLNYNYDPKADCPKWIKFLNHVLPEVNSQKVLQEYLGLIFLDRSKTKLEKMLFLFGTGSNGKSVVFETVKGILGNHNVSHYEISDLTTKTNMEYNIAAIDGKMLNYCSEVDKKELNGSSTKALISGEPRSARLPFKEPYTAYNIPLMMANANELPATSDHSKGYYRRMLIIPFDVEIKKHEQDLELSTKLKSEYSGILNWIFEGRERMIKQDYKFTDSSSVDQKILDYEIEANSALSFMKDMRYFPYAIQDGQYESLKTSTELYAEYKFWCQNNGYKAFSNKGFSSKIIEKGFMRERTREGNKYVLYTLPETSDYESTTTSIPKEIFEEITKFKFGFSSLSEILRITEEQKEETYQIKTYEETLPFVEEKKDFNELPF